MSSVVLIGLGEVGRIFTEDLTAAGHSVRAYDIAFADPESRACANARVLGLPTSEPLAATLDGAELVVSAVTPGSSLAAATTASEFLPASAWFFDMNSSSPGHKQGACDAITAGGGRYVEAALMSAIGGRRLGSPFILGGPHAEQFAGEAPRFGLNNITVDHARLGHAAATKLCRSVLVKGLETLFGESLLAARHYGVEREVLASLSNILPDGDWDKVARYFVSRSLEHGTRRSEEMYEAAATVRDAGVDPVMATASARRQAWAGTRGAAMPDGDVQASLTQLLDALLQQPQSVGDVHAAGPHDRPGRG